MPVALFNLSDDIAQKDNVAAQYPEKVIELRALLASLRENVQVRPLHADAAN